MISSCISSHHAPVLCRLAQTAAVAALLLNAATAATQAGTDKASAAPALVPAEPGATTASFGDWVLRCQRVGEADKVHLCEVGQAMQVQGQAAPIAQVAIGRLTASEPLRITAVLPVSVLFPGSVQIQGEDKPGEKALVPTLDLAWRRCLPGGCFADAPMPEDQLKRWHGFSGSARITFKDAAGREVAIPLSLRGLGPALDALGREKS